MKKLIATTVAALALATSAFAGDMTILGTATNNGNVTNMGTNLAVAQFGDEIVNGNQATGAGASVSAEDSLLANASINCGCGSALDVKLTASNTGVTANTGMNAVALQVGSEITNVNAATGATAGISLDNSVAGNLTVN